MLSFASTPPGSVGASTQQGKQAPSDSAPRSPNAGRAPGDSGAQPNDGPTKTSQPLLPGPAEPSAPLSDGLIWDDATKSLVGDLSVWQDSDQLVVERETPAEESADDLWDRIHVRANNAWSAEPSWSDGLREWWSVAAPYRWRERAWRRGFWRRRVLRTASLVVVVLTIALIAYGAFTLALRATHTSLTRLVPISSATPGPGGFVVSAPSGEQNATPTSPAYVIGTWVSDDTPSGGQVRLFARVTHNYRAVKGASVVFTVQSPGGVSTYGPAKTDSAGLAQVKITYNAGQGQVVFVIATTVYNGQDISADTSFTPF